MEILLGWLTSPAFTAFGAPTSWAEVLGFATGAACVWLVARQHILNWPLGIANNLLWILLFATAGLYADSALQVVYIAIALYGWWHWLHGGTGRTELRVSRTSVREWTGLLAAIVVATAAITVLLDVVTDSTVPFWDAVTTTLSLAAIWGQSRKKIESWWLWMLADVIYVPLYVSKGLTLTAILYVGFFALCIYGLRAWLADERADTAVPAAALPMAVAS